MTMLFTEELHQLIEQNYKRPDFDYGQLCQQLGLSRSQVYRKFQENDLGSPTTYLRQFRLGKARILLLETDAPIKEIAFEVGFKSASHFSNNFADFYKVSPKVYRTLEKK